MGGAKLLKWRLAAEGAKLLKSGAALILSIPRWLFTTHHIDAAHTARTAHCKTRYYIPILLRVTPPTSDPELSEALTLSSHALRTVRRPIKCKVLTQQELRSKCNNLPH